jgi:hypothetical protein
MPHGFFQKPQGFFIGDGLALLVVLLAESVFEKWVLAMVNDFPSVRVIIDVATGLFSHSCCLHILIILRF